MIPAPTQQPEQSAERNTDGLWPHHCPVEGDMMVGLGEPCNWCGGTEHNEPVHQRGMSVSQHRNRRAGDHAA